MISCRDLAILLIDYVANELPDEQRRIIEHHLHCCPPCHVYLETYQRTITLTRKLPGQPVPEQLVQRLKAALVEIQGETEGA